MKKFFGWTFTIAGIGNIIRGIGIASEGIIKSAGQSGGTILFYGIGFIGLGIWMISSGKKEKNNSSIILDENQNIESAEKSITKESIIIEARNNNNNNEIVQTFLFIIAFIVAISILIMYTSQKKNTNHSMYRIIENSKYGFIDSLGNKVIDTQYDYAAKFKDNITLVINDSLYGYVDKKGAEVIPLNNSLFDFASANFFEEEYRSHLINKPDTSFNYELFDDLNFSDGFAVFVDSTKLMGYKDISFKKVIEYKFERAYPFSEDVAVVQVKFDQEKHKIEHLNKETGIIDRNGNFIFQPQFYFCYPFENGYATAIIHDSKVDENNKYFYNLRAVLISKKGIIAKAFEAEINIVSNIFGSYVRGANIFMELQKYIDISGKLNHEIENLVFSDAKNPIKTSSTKETYIFPVKFEKNSKWGLISHDTRYTREDWNKTYFIYEDMMNCHEGLIAAKLNNLWGFINPNNEAIIPFNYTKVESFNNGLAYVEESQLSTTIRSYINKQGKVIYSFLEYKN